MITLILVLTTIVFLYFYFKKKYSYWSSMGVPGPTPLPFFGTFFADNRYGGKEAEKYYLKKYGKVWGTYSGTIPVFNTCEPEHIKQVLNDPATFQNFGLIELNDNYASKSIVFLNGARWKEGRKAMSAHFTSRKLKQLLDHFKLVSDNFLKNIEYIRETENTDEINAKEMFKFFAVDMISKYVFAVDIDSFKQHRKDSEFAKQALKIGDVNLFSILLMNFVPSQLTGLLGLHIFDIKPLNKLGDLFTKMLKQRDPNVKYDDLSEVLQNAIKEKKSEITEDEVVANSMISFFAGTDTTSQALTNVFYFLVEHPEQKEKLYEELKKDFSDEITYEKLSEHQYLDAFVSECLRLGQSLLLLDKKVAKDVVLEKGNYKLKKGTVVWLISYLTHTSEEYFPDPEKFDPNRFLDKSSSNPNIINNGTYLPFSAGNRACIGMRFALLEIKYLLVRILLNYDVYKPKNFKIVEISRRRFVFPLKMPICFRKRT